MSGAVEMLADRIAIADVLYRYARGIDRCDEILLRSVWWPDAQVDYGSGMVDAAEWSGSVVVALRAMRRTQHFIGNMLIDIDGTTAASESYCRAYHEVETANGFEEMEVGGRYLDRFDKRGGDWRITRRRYVLDWNRNTPSTALWEGGLYGGLRRRGARHPDDPSYSAG